MENHFDVILVGTGLPESILAGALAKSGKRILHLDQGEHYGSNYKTVNVHEFVNGKQMINQNISILQNMHTLVTKIVKISSYSNNN